MQEKLVLYPPPRGCRWEVEYDSDYAKARMYRRGSILDSTLVRVDEVDESALRDRLEEREGDYYGTLLAKMYPPKTPKSDERIDRDLWDATKEMAENYERKHRPFFYSIIRPRLGEN